MPAPPLSTPELVEELKFLLTWPLNAEEIAERLRTPVKDIDSRLRRHGLTEEDFAEQWRRRKNGYCPHCRQVNGAHLRDCRMGWGGQEDRRGRAGRLARAAKRAEREAAAAEVAK